MIKRIKICDFKSIGELELNLDPVTVLVGRSGSGKSNIVQAIRFLRNFLLDWPKAIEFEGGRERVYPVGVSKCKTSIEVEFSIPGDESNYRYYIEFGDEVRPFELMKEKLFHKNQPIFTRLREAHNYGWRWDHKPRVHTEPHLEDGSILRRLASMQEVVLAHAALSTGIGFYHFPASTLTRSTTSNTPHELASAIPGLADDAANYKDIIRGIIQNFHNPTLRESLTATLREVNPTVESVNLDNLVNPARAIVGHKAGGMNFGLNLEQESDGFRRFYAHLLALYQSPSKLTSVFEEPENAIFPGALSLLAEEFKSAPRENRGQVILTTHSPMLLDAFDVDNVRVVEMRDGKTIVGPVSKEQRQMVKDQLMSTGELLTVDRARIDEASLGKQVA